jgi:branched-chain amino acid aminotransferase
MAMVTNTQYPEFIWKNGEFVAWKDATTHIMSHALHYGSSVFEGIRAYETPNGVAIFRLKEHLHRLYKSASVYDLGIKFDAATLRAACFELLTKNGLKGAYFRPIVWRGVGAFGLGADNDCEIAIAAWNWGPYLGAEAREKGVDVCISSWQRLAPNTVPAMAKAGGNYLSSTLISREAKRLGFHEGIGLTRDGLLSEGAGENLFIGLDGKLYTPPMGASILNGITRHTVMALAERLGIEVIPQPLPRELLYFADEAFFTGTAAEITPLRSVDRKPLNLAAPGPMTKAIQDAFFGLFAGKTDDPNGWLEYR